MEIQQDIGQNRNARNRVKVAIRGRPMIPRQLLSHERSCIDVPSKQEIIIGNERSFKFDRVFKESSAQEEVYDECIKDLVVGCFEGYNAAVLAYGQTGSGKTYTMGTNTAAMEMAEEGILPRVIRDVFSQIDKRKNDASFTVKASFLEIYNEQIIDLLENQKNIKVKENVVSIREEKDGSISIHGVVEEHVNDSSEMLSLLDKGSVNRTTAATLMNDSSSRSHAIFTIFVEQHPLNQPDEGFITAKFFFVDLAGSERAKKTGASGATLKEGININLGLLELGNVISALAVERKQAQFITFRNSKLTRILQDSLGGNSNTYMIACISPAESNYEQSLNTLKYASKAMNIKNKPVVNRDPHSALLNQLRQRIRELQEENMRLRDLLKGEGINFESVLMKPITRNEEEIRKISLEMNLMERKNQKLFLDLKDEKKRKNQLQIQNYELQREKDIYVSMVEQFKINHPECQFQVDELYGKQNTPLIENYLNKIQLMQTELFDKEKVINQLQIQYSKLHQITEKNDQLLIKKNQAIYKQAKQNEILKKNVSELKKKIYEMNNIEDYEQEEQEEELSVINEIFEEEENLHEDQSFNRQAESYSKHQERMQTEIKSVQKFINEKENILQEIAQEQMQLEMKLILEMKEKYHQKISELEYEKSHLIHQQKSEINVHNTQKLSNKIDMLEIQLREYRNKAKEQRQIQSKVNQQSNTIKGLSNEIKNFKLQKIELNRKLKEDKEKFMKFKQARTHELMAAKKENLKKDVQIRKLTHENKKKGLTVLKRAEQIKKVKKVNDTLKKLLKPVRPAKSSKAAATSRFSLKSERDTGKKEEMVQIPTKQFDSLVSQCLRSMLLKIDRDFDLVRYSKKCEQINNELNILIREESTLILKIEQLNISGEQFDFDNIEKQIEKQEMDSKMKFDLNGMKERIQTLEQNLQFCQSKYTELLTSESKYEYNYQTAILYNSKYDNLNSMREILRSFIFSFHKLLVQNFDLKLTIEEGNIKNSSLLTQIEELKENIIRMNLQHQENITQIREELMFKMYEECYDDQGNNFNNQGEAQRHGYTPEPNQTANKMTDKQRKILLKKIDELNKNNNKLIADMDISRKKCAIIYEKYVSMRALFDKDKFVGGRSKEEENNINHPNNTAIKQNRKRHTPASYQVKVGNQPNNLLDQLNSMAEQLKSAKPKKNVSFGEEIREENENYGTPMFQNRKDNSRYKWECVGTIEAHSSPVLCVKSHKNLLISSANRNIKIWDLSDNKLVTDIMGSNLSYFVRSLAIHPEKQLLAAACDKVVNLYDLRQSSVEGTLRGHKEEVRCLHIVGNYLFTAGKGMSNSGSLLVWDLRYLNFNSPMEEKERNQDIFSMTSHKNTLYYGSRDHHVRRMNIDSLQTLTTFQPPHMDTVTGLAISKGYLISGSKDKNLRLWSLDNSIYNLKSTVHASNDYINCVEEDNYHPLFYAGDRTGQVKVGAIVKEKIEFVGGFGHSQSINSICSLEFNKGTATGSADKSIKIWQPTNETFNQIETHLC